MNIITRASVKERIHVEQIIRSQPHMHNSSLVDIFAALHPETAWGQMANDEMLAFFYRCAR